MIKPSKKGFKVVSKSGRNMGDFATRLEAAKRIQQVEYFKHKDKK